MADFIYGYETVFDHNPTPQEIEDLGLLTPEEIEAAAPEGIPPTPADFVYEPDYYEIAELYSYRGDQKNLEKYAALALESGIDPFLINHQLLGGGCIHFDD